ncbi:MAG: tetratricopeptide repeat protein [Bryobacteraceae bacterium]
MPQSPAKASGSAAYEEGWRAVNEQIRAGGSWSGRERNVCYRNLGEGRFEDASFVSGLDFPDDGRAWVTLDIDGDGDLDIVAKSRTAPQLRLLRNDAPAGNHGLIVDLESVGATATLVTATGKRITRVVRSGSGFLSQPSRRPHFGIARGDHPRSLEIVWPGGKRQTLDRLPESGLVRLGPTPPARSKVASPAESFVERPWLADPLPLPDPQLTSHRDKKLLLTLWASWCPPCRQELEEFTRRKADLAKAALHPVLLSVEEDKPAPSGSPFPVLQSDNRTIGVYSTLYRYLFDYRRDLALPTSFLIDEQGAIRKIYQGPVAVDDLLADASATVHPSLPFSGTRYFPAPARNFNDLATAMAERGFHDQAGALFAAALARGQGGYEIYNNYAGMLIATGKFAQAEKLLRASIQDNPNQPGSNANLGLLLMETNRAQEAVPLLEKAVALQPDDARSRRALSSYYNDLGIGHMQENRPGDALRAFERAVAADPTDPAAGVNLALYHAQAGNTARARALLRQLLEQHPGHKPAIDLLDQLR